jgi:hypothetical protein
MVRQFWREAKKAVLRRIVGRFTGQDAVVWAQTTTGYQTPVSASRADPCKTELIKADIAAPPESDKRDASGANPLRTNRQCCRERIAVRFAAPIFVTAVLGVHHRADPCKIGARRATGITLSVLTWGAR